MLNRIHTLAARIGRRKMLVGAAGLISLLLLYAALGFLALPGMIKSKAEQLVLQKLHRPLSIEQVEVNPFALSIRMQGVRLLEPDGKTEFVAVGQAYLNLSISTLFRMAPVVQELRLIDPHARLVRYGSNHYNIDDLVALALEPKQDKEQARFSLHNIQVEGGHIEFDDQPKKVRHMIEDLKLGIPFVSSLPSQVDVFVEPMLSARVNGAPLLVKGKARPFAADKDAAVDFQIDDIDLPRYMEYLPFEPRFKLPQGRLSVDLTVNFTQPKEQSPAVTIDGGLSVKSLRLMELSGAPILHLSELKVSGVNANLSAGQVRIGNIELDGPQAHIMKSADGTLNLSLLAPETASAADSSGKQAVSPDIRIALDHLLIKDGSASYSDAQTAQGTKMSADKLNLKAGKIALDLRKRDLEIEHVESSSGQVVMVHARREPGQGSDSASAKNGGGKDSGETGLAFRLGKLAIGGWSLRVEDQTQAQPAVTLISPMAITLTDLSSKPGSKGTIDVQANVNQGGSLSVKGGIGLTPLQADLDLNLKDVDILAVQPYVSDKINLVVKRANLSTQGRLQLVQDGSGEIKGGFKGNASIGNLVTVDKVSGNDFLRWKRLSFAGVDAGLSPFSLTIGQVSLNDFFARVIISREGRINLQDIVRKGEGRQKSLTEEDQQVASGPPAPGDSRAEPPVAPAGSMPPINIGKFVMQNGRVRFTDNFIQPNYSALLSNLSGTVSKLSSDASTAAEVDVIGEVSGAPLTIDGSVNPLSGNLFLDIRAAVDGMELAPLSAYSAKYAGYGIERGKLSFDVAYKVENRQLTAKNRLVLNQLELGDRVESPSATKLPVRLALALLQDRNGVIDVNLPISGSLNDPEFSIGGLLVRAFVNLLAKAATAPFTLIGSLFHGGGEELSWLEFDPGSRIIPADGKAKLESISKALIDRPGLHLEITGRIDPVADKEGLAYAAIQRKVRALKRADMEKGGKSVDIAAVNVQPAEYPGLLKRVYSEEKFAKPRNLIGLQKDLPVSEMERLMIANYTVSDDDLVTLANQRAQAAKAWLTTEGKVPAERIFILAGKSGAGHKSARASRVDFSLR